MPNLQRYDNDGIELIINTETGESFASVSGYARMSGKDQSTISKRLGRMNRLLRQEAQILTSTGSKTVALINEDTISDWIVDDNPELAKQLIKIGVRAFNHKLAGYKLTTIPQPDLTAINDRLNELHTENQVLREQLRRIEAVEPELDTTALETLIEMLSVHNPEGLMELTAQLATTLFMVGVDISKQKAKKSQVIKNFDKMVTHYHGKSYVDLDNPNSLLPLINVLRKVSKTNPLITKRDVYTNFRIRIIVDGQKVPMNAAVAQKVFIRLQELGYGHIEGKYFRLKEELSLAE
ncbi:hypothetical protein [Crocosphaera sp.]|uniref:hypothetical protein n=1 Tax=Crocosphaera sp. TaxID=2729996 RepID=UPI002602E9AC|nr:hypothetical protein [Crocosphaera sp.]MDJ0579047.1 hypothetical protein [Crocosphaera sp.]